MTAEALLPVAGVAAPAGAAGAAGATSATSATRMIGVPSVPATRATGAAGATGVLGGGRRLARRDETPWSETAARLRGAAEALDMLADRPLATRQRASQYGVALLLRHVVPADWGRSGLPVPKGIPYRQPRGGSVPLSDNSVMRLATASMRLYCAGLSVTDQSCRSAQLAQFFAHYVPECDSGLAELRAMAARAAY